MAGDACSRFGLQLPPELQPEYLMRQTLMPEPALTEDSEKHYRQHLLAADLQHERNIQAHSKLLTLQAAIAARSLSDLSGSHVTEAQLLAERQALEMAATPLNLDAGGWLLARDYLLFRGHSLEEVRDLESSFGKLVKQVWQQAYGTEPETVPRDYPQYQGVDVPTCRYHMTRDAAVLNAAYQAFSVTELYRSRVTPAAQAINNL
jgi:hypothetical protein